MRSIAALLILCVLAVSVSERVANWKWCKRAAAYRGICAEIRML